MYILNLLTNQLTWWQLSLVSIFTIYTLLRAWHIYEVGYKYSLLGYGAKSVKLYHIIWFIVDIPAVILGQFFPLIKFLFSVDVFPLKQDKK